MLHIAEQSYTEPYSQPRPGGNPGRYIRKISILIDAGADVNLATCGLTPLATLTGIPYMARKMEKAYMETITLNIDYSTDMCHVNGVAKICKDTSPGEREQMKTEIRQIFQEEMKKIEPYYIKIADILLQHGADINKNPTKLRRCTLRHRFLKMKNRYC